MSSVPPKNDMRSNLLRFLPTHNGQIRALLELLSGFRLIFTTKKWNLSMKWESEYDGRQINKWYNKIKI